MSARYDLEPLILPGGSGRVSRLFLSLVPTICLKGDVQKCVSSKEKVREKGQDHKTQEPHLGLFFEAYTPSLWGTGLWFGHQRENKR